MSSPIQNQREVTPILSPILKSWTPQVLTQDVGEDFEEVEVHAGGAFGAGLGEDASAGEERIRGSRHSELEAVVPAGKHLDHQPNFSTRA